MMARWARFWCVLMIGFCTLCAQAKVVKKKVRIETAFGPMVMELYPEVAPKHVENFLKHIQDKTYDNTLFHRVIDGFMVQGGDPMSKQQNKDLYGMGGHAARYFGIGDKTDEATWRVPAEFSKVKHRKGTLSMARSQDPDSAGSQFFICLADLPFLDGQYTVFGQLLEGEKVLDKLGKVATNAQDQPVKPVSMQVKLAH